MAADANRNRYSARSENLRNDESPAKASSAGPPIQWRKQRVAMITPARSPGARDIELAMAGRQEIIPNRATTVRGWRKHMPLKGERKL